MAKTESWGTRIRRARELWALLFIVVIMVSVFVVITLPLPIDPWTQDAYNVLSTYAIGGSNYGLAPTSGQNHNSVVMVMHAESYTDVLPLGTAIEAFWNYVVKFNVSVIVFTAHVEAGQTQRCLYELRLHYGQSFPNVTQYGHSVVFLGYTPSSTMPPVWNDLWTAFGGHDFFGNSFASLPIMENENPSHSLRDFNVVVSLSPWSETNWPEIHSFGVNYILNWANEVQKGDVLKWIQMGWCQGAVLGPRGGYEFEQLSGIPGSNSLLTTTPIWGALYVIIGIVIANIYGVAMMRRKKTPPK